MNLFFYLQTFILNYSFIIILSDYIFLLCFIKTQPFVKRKPVKTEKKIPERSRSVLGRFYCTIFFSRIMDSLLKYRANIPFLIVRRSNRCYDEQLPPCSSFNTAEFTQGTQMKHSVHRQKQITSKTGLCRRTTQSRFVQTAAATGSHVFNLQDCSPAGVCYS